MRMHTKRITCAIPVPISPLPMTESLVMALTVEEEEKHLVVLEEARWSWRRAAADILRAASNPEYFPQYNAVVGT